MNILYRQKYNAGLLRTILLVIIALIILGYFGLNVREIVSSPAVQANLAYFKEIVFWIWENLLKGIVMFLWNEVLKLKN